MGLVAEAAALRELTSRVAPVTLAKDQLLAVSPILSDVFPHGLRRGSVVGIAGAAGAPGSGATTLALSLLAGPIAAGSWGAVVGEPSLGPAAAAEQGIDLARLALVPRPGSQWATVVAALVDAFDIVIVRGRCRASDARRLAARARERGAVLVPAGSGWPEAPDVTLTVERSQWHGLGDGHGHLQARRIDVVVTGRRSAARQRRISIVFALEAELLGESSGVRLRRTSLVSRTTGKAGSIRGSKAKV